jgi:hypothetical protein
MKTQIARRLLISLPEVAGALDKILPTLDHRYRKQAISEALLIIDTVIGVHMSKVSDPESASVVIRGLCEKRFWSGITGSTDPVQLVEASRATTEDSNSGIERALKWVEKLKLLDQGKPKPEQPDKPK